MIRPGHKIRIMILLGICACAYAAVLGRLYWVQVHSGDFFNTLAAQQHVTGVLGSNPRGGIFDRYGQPVAMNKEFFSAFILPHLADKDHLLGFLKEQYPQVFERVLAHHDRYFFWLERRLTPERYAWLKEQKNNAIQFALESARYYPYPEFSHVLGFADIDNKGIAGLELALESKLAGEPARYTIAKDARAHRYYFEKKVEHEGVAGSSVTLTIDKDLQFLVYQDLAQAVESFRALQGAAIVMDPYSGEILSMVSYPTFDANNIAGIDLALTKNIAVTDCYEIGSVMKTFSALAGLEEGVVDYDEIFDCEGKITFINGLRVENWKTLGVMPFYEAVKNSSNVAVAKVGLRLGKKLYDHLLRVGFGRKTTLGFPGERRGFVNAPNKWSKFSVMVMTFGYEVTVTLLQVARAMGIIANGGYPVEPTLFKDPIEQQLCHSEPLYSKQSIDHITEILELVGARYPIPGFKLRGKTGTARMVVDGKYSTKKHVYTFAGFVAKDDYKRVIITCIKEPEKAHLWAADVVAPLAQKIAEHLAIHDFSHGTLQ